MKTKGTKRESGLALLTVVGVMFLLLILGSAMISLVATGRATSLDSLQATQAFYVADGGTQYILMNQFAGDTDFSDNLSPTDPPFGPNAISLGAGRFWIEYLNQQADSITVRVTARVGDAVRVIQQAAGQGGSGEQYVTLADGNLNMNSSSGDIYGDVAVTGNTSIPEEVVVHGNIVQNPVLTVPSLDFSVYEAMCDTTIAGSYVVNANDTGDLCVTGSATIQGNVTFNGLLYVGGSVQVQGNNVIFNGSLVSEGNINADGRTGLRFNAQPGPNPGTHMPAIAADGNLSIKNADGAVINGVVWNTGNIDLSNSDGLDFRGSFMSGGNVLINSASGVSITFDSDLSAGIPGLQGGGGAVTGSLSLSGCNSN